MTREGFFYGLKEVKVAEFMGFRIYDKQPN